MSDFGHILEDEAQRKALVEHRVAGLLKLYTNGRLSENGKAELRGYLGGRLPNEDTPPTAEGAQISPTAPAPETPPSVVASAPIAEPDPQKERAAWLLRRWLQRTADAGETRELQQLFPHAPNLVGHLTRATYKKPLIEYARALGYKADATLKRWLDDGRAMDPPDLPPFDQPGQLAVWWSRVKKRKVPDELLAVADPNAGVASPLSSGATAAPASSTPPPAAANSGDRDDSQRSPAPMHEGSGFSASLERARENERHAARSLFDARQKKELGAIRMAQDTWNKAFQELRRAEMDASAILIANGEMVRWPEVEADMFEKLQVVNQSIRSLMIRVATKVTVPPELLRALTRVFNEELDRVFEDLDKSGYEQPYRLAA